MEIRNLRVAWFLQTETKFIMNYIMNHLILWSKYNFPYFLLCKYYSFKWLQNYTYKLCKMYNFN